MDKPLVVGYKGEIGRFILEGLLRVMPKALDILCVDINETDTEVKERIEISDMIFLCVPMHITVSWILKYKNLLRDKIIVEQCSLKEWIYNTERLKNLDIRSMHILFRPSQTPDVEDRKIGIFKGQFEKFIPEDIAEITQSEIVWYENAKQHDKEMAIQQALVHRTLLLLGNALKTCNGSTYVSKKVLELSKRIRTGDLGLYKLIQENKYLDGPLEDLLKKFDGFKIEEYW